MIDSHVAALSNGRKSSCFPPSHLLLLVTPTYSAINKILVRSHGPSPFRHARAHHAKKKKSEKDLFKKKETEKEKEVVLRVGFFVEPISDALVLSVLTVFIFSLYFFSLVNSTFCAFSSLE